MGGCEKVILVQPYLVSSLGKPLSVTEQLYPKKLDVVV